MKNRGTKHSKDNGIGSAVLFGSLAECGVLLGLAVILTMLTRKQVIGEGIPAPAVCMIPTLLISSAAGALVSVRLASAHRLPAALAAGTVCFLIVLGLHGLYSTGTSNVVLGTVCCFAAPTAIGLTDTWKRNTKRSNFGPHYRK